jgi:putative peptidoglycan lipid II flippase
MLRSVFLKIKGKSNKILSNPLISNILLVGGLSLLVIPTFVQSVFIGSLKNLFIPNYIKEQKTTENIGSFQTITFIIINLLVAILTVMAFIFVRFFLENVFPGHTQSYYELIRSQFYIVAPCLLLWGYSGFLSGLLEIKNKFLITSISQFFLPIITILCIVFLKPFFGDITLVIALTLGSFCSFLHLLYMAFREKVLLFAKPKLNDNISAMIQQYTPKATSGLLTGINPFVDQFFAAQLVIGSISAINYGTKIPAFVVGILMLALGNVLLPHFSNSVNENIEKAYKQLFKILKIVFLISFVVAISGIIFSNDIVRLLFERNEFTSKDTYIVSNIQKITLIYVPFYLCTLVCVKFLTAINQNKFMAWTSFWNLLLNLIMNIVLVKYLAIYGLVLSTTIVYVIASTIYVGYTFKLYSRYLNQKT